MMPRLLELELEDVELEENFILLLALKQNTQNTKAQRVFIAKTIFSTTAEAQGSPGIVTSVVKTLYEMLSKPAQGDVDLSKYRAQVGIPTLGGRLDWTLAP